MVHHQAAGPRRIRSPRYESRTTGILDSGLTDEIKAKVLSAVRKHAAALEGLQERVA